MVQVRRTGFGCRVDDWGSEELLLARFFWQC